VQPVGPPASRLAPYEYAGRGAIESGFTGLTLPEDRMRRLAVVGLVAFALLATVALTAIAIGWRDAVNDRSAQAVKLAATETEVKASDDKASALAAELRSTSDELSDLRHTFDGEVHRARREAFARGREREYKAVFSGLTARGWYIFRVGWDEGRLMFRTRFRAEGGNQYLIQGDKVFTLPPDYNFCLTHACIANFWEGNGSVVQCADGMWSHSAGLPGVCSRHGGERE
jgi:hypothetical protein